MRLGVAGIGLLVVAATALSVIWLTLRGFDVKPSPRRNPAQERLVALAPDDERWLGTYRLFSELGIEFLPAGAYRQPSTLESDSDAWCGTGSLGGAESRWTRTGSTVRVAPANGVSKMEYELGLLDGEYALLGEFTAWRRAR